MSPKNLRNAVVLITKHFDNRSLKLGKSVHVQIHSFEDIIFCHEKVIYQLIIYFLK